MAYEKRVLILKQAERDNLSDKKPFSAICRIEQEDGVSTLHLTAVNCLPVNGEYYLFVIDGTYFVHSFNLGISARASGLYFLREPNTKKGVAVGLCAVKDDIPLTIAFARQDGFDYTKEQFKKAVAEYFIEQRKNKSRKERESKPTPQSPCKEPTKPTPTKPICPPLEEPDPNVTPEQEFPSPKDELYQTSYNDEAVATENYFENEPSFSKKLKTFEEIDYGCLRLEDDLPFSSCKTEKTKNQQDRNRFQDEANLDNGKTTKTNRPYYQTVKKELSAVLNKFPAEDALEKIFCDSNFVKINYTPDKFYVVGLIKEDCVEKYICYGVPGKYSPEPPKELKGYCTFIPLSIFNVCGDGYWMMFQDACTGKCITPVTA